MNIADSGRIRWALGLGAALALVACGDDDGGVSQVSSQHDAAASDEQPQDASDASVPDEDEDEFDIAESRALAALQDPETLQGLCTAAGLAALSADGGVEACEAAIEQCVEGAEMPLDLDAGTLALPLGLPDDLSAQLDCPITATELDACFADLIAVAANNAASASCEEPELGEFDTADLLGALSCATVFINCPELITPLLDTLAEM